MYFTIVGQSKLFNNITHVNYASLDKALVFKTFNSVTRHFEKYSTANRQSCRYWQTLNYAWAYPSSPEPVLLMLFIKQGSKQ